MKNALSMLAAAAFLAAPAIASADHQKTTTRSVTVISVPAAEYDRLQRAGYSTQEIYYAYNCAAHCSKSPEALLSMRKNGHSWERISSDTGVAIADIYGTPVSKVAGQRMEVTFQNTGSGRGGTTIGKYGAQDLPLSDRWYRENRYRLTPREYYRLRAQGFSRDEVFMIANAAKATGMDTRIFADAIYRGMYGRSISIEWGIAPSKLTRVDPEWKTQEWADAVHESVYTKDRLNVGL